MSEKITYEVLKDADIADKAFKAGETVELTSEEAAPLIEQGILKGDA